MRDMVINIKLIPGLFSMEIIEKILHLTIEEYKWLIPTKYGHIDADLKIKQSTYNDYKNDLLDLYRKYNDLCLGKGNNYLIISPYKNFFIGKIYFISTNLSNVFEFGLSNEQLNKIMSLVNSPIAISAAKEMYDKYQLREIQRDGYTEGTYTVKDYSQGLQNAFWRMWFGREYVEFFGKEKVDNAPAYFKEYNSDTGIYFIQLFESPYDWNTPEGIKATEKFKDWVGRESFYDPSNPEKVLKAPDFSQLL